MNYDRIVLKCREALMSLQNPDEPRIGEKHVCDECGWEFVINDYWDANYDEVIRNDPTGEPLEVRCPSCDCLVYEADG